MLRWCVAPVNNRACLAIDAAAQRAQLEGLALHERQKNGEKKKAFQGNHRLISNDNGISGNGGIYVLWC